MKDIVIVGGGKSISEGVSLDLWNKIKDKAEIWSINFAFMVMPYLPHSEIWVDISFFRNYMDKLQSLHKQGVKCYAKKHHTYAGIPEIITYETTRDPKDIYKKMFIGRMGLSGFFALHLALKQENVKNIYLLGFDFGSSTTKTHFYQDTIQVKSSGVNKPELYRDRSGRIKDEVRDFDVLRLEADKRNIKVYNVSSESAIECFEKIDYTTFFNLLETK